VDGKQQSRRRDNPQRLSEIRCEEEWILVAHHPIRKPEDHPRIKSEGRLLRDDALFRPWQAWQRPALPSLENVSIAFSAENREPLFRKMLADHRRSGL
jgi:hypothetical protein